METLLMYGFEDSPLNNKYQEILKLDGMLNNANIPHVLKRMFDGWQVCYPSDDEKDMVMDAIEHFGSFGKEDDKLEIMGLLTPEEEKDGPVLGHLTADEVFMRIWYHCHYQWESFCEIHSKPEESEESEEPEENHVLTPKEFAKAMKDISDKLVNPPKDRPYYDEEYGHAEMDDLMCDLLRSLGYGDGVDIFENTDKWYS